MNIISYILATLIALVLIVDVFTCLDLFYFLKGIITFNFSLMNETVQSLSVLQVMLLFFSPKIIKILYNAIQFEVV